ncbi:MAG: antibiotic biosynthesis monooxygenase family protein [Dehalococcoidales bacterium]
MVKVVLERHLKAGKRGDFIHLLKELRTATIHHRGYVTGETLSSIDDSSVILVLSMWQSLEDWKAWEESPQRLDLEEKVEPLLSENPRVNVYQVMATE